METIPSDLLEERCDKWFEEMNELITSTLKHFPEEVHAITKQMLRIAFAAGASAGVEVISASLHAHQIETETASPSTPDSQE